MEPNFSVLSHSPKGCRFLGWWLSFVSISIMTIYCFVCLVFSLAITEASAIVELRDHLKENNLPDCARLIRLFGQTKTIRAIIPEINGVFSKISANYILSPDLTESESSTITKENVDNTFKLFELAVRQRWSGLFDEISWQIEKEESVRAQVKSGVSIELLKFLQLKTGTILSEEELKLNLENKKKLLDESLITALDQQFLIRKALVDHLGLNLSEQDASSLRENKLPSASEKAPPGDGFIVTHYKSGILAGLPVVPNIPDQIKNFDQLISLASQFGNEPLIIRKNELEAKILQLHLTYQPIAKFLDNFKEEKVSVDKSIQESISRLQEAQSDLFNELQEVLTNSARTLFGINFSNPLIKFVTKTYATVSSQALNPK